MNFVHALRISGGSLAVALGLFSSSARADAILNPGDNSVALSGSAYNTAGGVAPGATLVASTTADPISLIPGGHLAGATLNEAVYQETGGTLDFLYQIVNGSTAIIDTASIANFKGTPANGYDESIGYATVLPSPSGPFSTLGTAGDPSSASRTADASENTFNFSPNLNPGDTSEIFWIRTDATSYDANGLVTASGTASNDAINVYEPTGVVPEPSMLAGGLAAIGLSALRRRRQKA